jgi:hypothetical protein
MGTGEGQFNKNIKLTDVAFTQYPYRSKGNI